MSKWLSTVLVVLALGGSSACASKDFVKARVKDLNDKVEALSQSVEETQERTRRNEGSIGDVDQKAQAAQGSAYQARQAAGDADAKARAAGVKADAADARTEGIETASKRLLYTVVLSEDQGRFTFGGTALPDEAKARLDKLVSQLVGQPQGVYLEIEGHTDAVGPKSVNERVGLDRAEAVKRYLFEQHHIPLHKMNVISYGLEKPVASNKTKDGRARNRRVVIRVLA